MIEWQHLMAFWTWLDWQGNKVALITHADVSRDALHVYLAVLIFLGACWVLRWKAGSLKPWLLVFLLQSLNELSDMGILTGEGTWAPTWENAKDTINTMIIPTILVISARYTSIFERKKSGNEPEV